MMEEQFLQGDAINPTGPSSSREVHCLLGDLLLVAGDGHHLKQFHTPGIKVKGAFLVDVRIRVLLAEDVQVWCKPGWATL